MRFIGSKKRLLEPIKKMISKHADGTEHSFTDLFAGSNIVGLSFKPKYKIISNDLLSFSNVIAKALIENNNIPKFKKLRKIGIKDPFKYLDTKNLKNYKGNFITKHYSPSGIMNRMYFRTKNAKRIDFIRLSIRNWKNKNLISTPEFYYLLNSLIQAVPFVSNITGTYGAYLKHWDKRAFKDLQIKPFPVINNHQHNEAYQYDSLNLANRLTGDIAYIDTPYNSRQYAPNYHILETITRYDYPKLHGKTGMRNYNNEKSLFSMKRQAGKAMQKLLKELSFKHVLLSYSTDGIVSINKLIAMIQRVAVSGSIDIMKIPYNRYKSKINYQHPLNEELFYFKPKRYYKINHHYSHTNTQQLSLFKVPKSGFIKSPLNYIGGKYKLLPQIIPHFPKNIDTFIDLFSGGANVGININARRIIFNDINTKINGLFRYLQGKDPFKVIKQINALIKKYHLSKTNKNGFLKLRRDYNHNQTPLKLYTLVSYSFNYQFRFNNKMQYNNPFGKNRSHFSTNMKYHLLKFMNKLNSINATFTEDYFTDLDLSHLTQKSFVYADPPYLITDGSYNDGNRGFINWTNKQEHQLHNELNHLTKRKIKFALSNVYKHKGHYNTQLRNWVRHNHYHVYHLTCNYRNSSYNTKRKDSDEVLITNY